MRPRDIVLATAAAFTIQAAAQQTLPDPAAGEIDGKQAVLLWPADGRVGGCRATLVPETDPDTELHYQCGEWFIPPFGRYKAWIEGPASISAAPSRLVYQSSQFSGKGLMAVVETTSAGEVMLETPWPGTSFRAINLESFTFGSVLAPAFDRRASGDEVRPIRMPAGRLLAGVFDPRSGDAVALARPVHIRAGGLTHVKPALPESGTDVLVVLDRPKVRTQAEEDAVAFQLEVDGQRSPPGVLADSADRVYAVWYGVEGRRARVIANGRELTFAGREFPLFSRRVITVRGQLQPLPKLRAEIAPGADLPADAHIQAKRLTGEVLIDVPLLDRMVDLGHMPAETIEVMLLSPEIELRRRVDLTSGIDDAVVFQPEPLTIRGRLTRGERGVSGSIAFTLGTRRPVTVATDDDGSYTAKLWAAGLYRVVATASGTPPFEAGGRQLASDSVLNIDLPRASVVIEVVDETSRAPIVGARIAAVPAGGTSRALSRAQRAVTDGGGSATLPPIDPGTIELNLAADDYLAAERVLQVADSDETQHFTVELRPADANRTDRISLQLADGTPASGAQLMLTDRGLSASLWAGRADASGAAGVPRIAGTILLVRHTQAASIPLLVTDGLEVRLPAPAPPLAVRFVNASGIPARYAGIILWVGGVRVSGGAMNFLYGFPNATNVDGIWRGNNLPEAPLRILAVTAATGKFTAPEALDTLAMTIPYPWPELPTLSAIE
jgi:hypothetical protein